MNCKKCQEKILESLAADKDFLAPDVVGHQNSCVGCAQFFDVQRNLFRSVDAGLRLLVNQPVPPSLLPGVRARMDEKSIPLRAWTSRWSYAVVSAVAILAVSIGYAMLRPVNHLNFPKASLIASRTIGNPQPAVQPSPESAKVLPKPRDKRVGPVVSSPAAPEVIVLAEERQAFSKFVAEVPEKRDAVLALMRASPTESDDSVEIALLQIDSLEVKPLEAKAKE
jgi:hypothetical protein